MELGTCPAARRFTNFVSEVNKLLAWIGDGHSMGKDFTPLSTAVSLRVIGGGTGPGGRLGGGSCGYFNNISLLWHLMDWLDLKR